MPQIDLSQPVLRGYIARVEDVDAKERTVVGKINTSALDHYRTVIEPKGIELSAITAIASCSGSTAWTPSAAACPWAAMAGSDRQSVPTAPS